METQSIRRAIESMDGYSDLKRRMLCGELERYRRSIEWIAPSSGGDLLDLGSCGDLVPLYRDYLGYQRIVCLDAMNPSGTRALRRADGRAFEFESLKVDLEFEPYPFDDSSFDQVVAMEVLEHLARDPMFMLAEANRLLRHGGTLLLTTPNITSLASVYHQLWGRHPAIGGQMYGPGILDRHHREYTPQEIRAIIPAAGFEILDVDTFDVAPPNASVRRVDRLLKVLRLFKSGLDVGERGSVIRCRCRKTGPVVERFPEALYPRYPYYDYAAYDEELAGRFKGRRYWHTNAFENKPSARAPQFSLT